jgi:hypothetical protein
MLFTDGRVLEGRFENGNFLGSDNGSRVGTTSKEHTGDEHIQKCETLTN